MATTQAMLMSDVPISTPCGPNTWTNGASSQN
jgi:hypothetical protein